MVAFNRCVRKLLTFEAPLVGLVFGRIYIMARHTEVRFTCFRCPGIDGERNLPRNILENRRSERVGVDERLSVRTCNVWRKRSSTSAVRFKISFLIFVR